jgi:hypothetical protein
MTAIMDKSQSSSTTSAATVWDYGDGRIETISGYVGVTAMRDYIDDHNCVNPHRDIGTDVNVCVDAINGPVAAINDYDEIDVGHFDDPNIPSRATKASTRYETARV